MTLRNTPHDSLPTEAQNEINLTDAQDAIKTARRTVFKYYDGYDEQIDAVWDVTYYIITQNTDDEWYAQLMINCDNEITADGWEEYVQDNETQAQAFTLVKNHLESYVEASH